MELFSTQTNLQRNQVGRPCQPGINGDQALQNLKQWVRDQVPHAKQQFIFESGELGMGIGSLTQDEFNTLQSHLSFTMPIPMSAWVATMATGGHSLAGVIAITGTGLRQATMCKSPSTVFND